MDKYPKNTTPAERAADLFRQGHTCAEAVYMAFAEEEGFASEELHKACSMFFVGLCFLGGNYCMLLGDLFVIGVQDSSTDLAESAARVDVQGTELILWFDERFGSTNCEEILDLNSQESEHKARYWGEDRFEKPCIPIVIETCEWLAVQDRQG
jgi:hypothetical protein